MVLKAAFPEKYWKTTWIAQLQWGISWFPGNLKAMNSHTGKMTSG
jgi:hypothetical protein